MNEKLKGYLTKAKTGLGKVSKKIWILAAVAIVAIAVVATVLLNNRPYAVLVTDVTSDEMTAILSWMNSQNIVDYQVEGNDTILVPEAQESAIRGKMLMEGYPKSGYNYDTYFNNINAISTNSERETALRIALEEKMAATIRTFEGVRDATVSINPGEDRGYVLDSNKVVEATAAVHLIMKDGVRLTSQQASAIRTLVSRAVASLDIDSVSITDNWGNLYSGSGDTFDSDASALKIQLEEEWANAIRTDVMYVLAPLFGEENMRVAVRCTVDVSNSVIDDYDVHQPDWAADGSTNGAGIISSRRYEYTILTPDGTIPGGTVGTTTNADLPTVVEQEPAVDNGDNRITGSGGLDYENPNTKTHTIRTAAYITDCTIAVTINSTAAGPVDLNEIRVHAATAAGIDPVTTETMTAEEYLASKVSVLSSPFYQPPAEPEPVTPGGNEIFKLPIPDWMVLAAAAGLLLFVILLVVILLIRRKRKKKKKMLAEQQALEMEQFLAAAGIPQAEAMGADVMSLQTEKSMELRQDIRKFADENPEIAAQLVKAWLRGDDDNA